MSVFIKLIEILANELVSASITSLFLHAIVVDLIRGSLVEMGDTI